MTNDTPDYAILHLTLTSMFGAHVQDVVNEHGDMERCVCIPIDRNGLTVHKNGNVYTQCFITKTRNANRFGYTHNVRLKTSKSFYRKMKELGYEIPYLGYVKPSHMRYDNGNGNSNQHKKVSKEDWE